MSDPYKGWPEVTVGSVGELARTVQGITGSGAKDPHKPANFKPCCADLERAVERGYACDAIHWNESAGKWFGWSGRCGSGPSAELLWCPFCGERLPQGQGIREGGT